MDKRRVADLVDYLIAVSAGTSVSGAPYQLHFIAKLTDYINAVVSRRVVKYKNAIVALL